MVPKHRFYQDWFSRASRSSSVGFLTLKKIAMITRLRMINPPARKAKLILLANATMMLYTFASNPGGVIRIPAYEGSVKMLRTPVSWGMKSNIPGTRDWSSDVILPSMIIAKTAVPMVAPIERMRLTADVVIPISRVGELF